MGFRVSGLCKRGFRVYRALLAVVRLRVWGSRGLLRDEASGNLAVGRRTWSLSGLKAAACEAEGSNL